MHIIILCSHSFPPSLPFLIPFPTPLLLVLTPPHTLFSLLLLCYMCFISSLLDSRPLWPFSHRLLFSTHTHRDTQHIHGHINSHNTHRHTETGKHIFTEHLWFARHFRQHGLPGSRFWARFLGTFLESVPLENKGKIARWGRGTVRLQCSYKGSAWLHGELGSLAEPSTMRQGG